MPASQKLSRKLSVQMYKSQVVSIVVLLVLWHNSSPPPVPSEIGRHSSRVWCKPFCPTGGAWHSSLRGPSDGASYEAIPRTSPRGSSQDSWQGHPTSSTMPSCTFLLNFLIPSGKCSSLPTCKTKGFLKSDFAHSVLPALDCARTTKKG